MVTSYKFPGHPSANCCILVDKYDDGNFKGIYLQSYSTIVCGYKHSSRREDCRLFCNGTFSATTRKHIGYFCKLYGIFGDKGISRLSYYTFKEIFEKGIERTVTDAEYYAIKQFVMNLDSLIGVL